jgi:phosphoglycerate kinase
MAIRTLDDLPAADAAVGVRVDINSPLAEDDSLADDARLRAHVDTLAELLDAGARVAVLAHQGRPGGDEFARLESHADRLDDLLDHDVGYCDATFSAEAREAIEALDGGEAVLLENTRFYSEEYMEFDPVVAGGTHLVEGLVPALDCYVNDAFAAAHRSQPSLVGFPELLDSYAGRVMEEELDVLGAIEETPTPRSYVVGGAKVPDSVMVAEHALEHGLAEDVLVTGVVANVITPVATIVLMIPVAAEAAVQLGANAFAFILAVTFAASTAFMTPVGYQTNLFVYGPGGYRFMDYVKVGAPLQAIFAVVTTLGIAFFWGLTP